MTIVTNFKNNNGLYYNLAMLKKIVCFNLKSGPGFRQGR
jgi:hypothetical protein